MENFNISEMEYKIVDGNYMMTILSPVWSVEQMYVFILWWLFQTKKAKPVKALLFKFWSSCPCR